MINDTSLSPSASNRRALRGEELSILYRDIDSVFAAGKNEREMPQNISVLADNSYKGVASCAIYSPQDARRMH